MKLKNKNKGMLVLRFLLMMCWSLLGHHILNKYAFDQLKPEFKTKFSQTSNRNTNLNRSDILVQARDRYSCASAGTWCDADTVDPPRGISHTGSNVINNTLEPMANRYIPMAKDYYVAGDIDHAAYTLGFGLHYIQDALCPPHAGHHTGLLHRKYEGAGDEQAEWTSPLKYNIQCSSSGNCPGYQAVLNSGYLQRTEELLAQSSYKNLTGKDLITNSTLKNYVGTTRWNNWLSAYNAGNYSTTRNYILWDLAFAMNVQRRYLKNSKYNYFFK